MSSGERVVLTLGDLTVTVSDEYPTIPLTIKRGNDWLSLSRDDAAALAVALTAFLAATNTETPNE